MTLELVPPPDEPDGVVQTVQNASPDTWTPAAPARPLHRAERVRWGPLVYRIRDLGERRPATVRTVQWTAAAAVQIVQGHAVWGRRLWDAATHAKVREQVRATELAGDREAFAEWSDRLENHKTQRSKRLVDMPKALYGATMLALGGLALLGLLMLALGVLVALTRPAGWTWGRYWHLYADIAHIVAATTVWTIQIGIFAIWPIWLIAAHRAGRIVERPGWLATSAVDEDVVIDETTVARALSQLRIPEISNYLKRGLPLHYLTPCRTDGRGTFFEIRVPGGVAAAEICRPQRRERLAAGLHRSVKEVWPKTGSEAGILQGWIADKGSLDSGAGPYPLLDHGFVDIYKGVPFGKNLRGDPLSAPIIGRNTIVGGMPEQGKSTAGRAIMLGCSLDITAELRIWIPDTNFDFEHFRPRASRYVMGSDPEHIERIRDDLVELKAELQYRGKLLVQHGIQEVERVHASRIPGLHPIVCILEEAHVAIQDKTYGKEIAQLLCDIVKLGRKRAVHVIVSTQAPTKDSMPRDVTRNCSNGIAFAVGDHVANDALLGQGAYRAGHRATDLIPGSDRGTAVVKGFVAESRSELAQGYNVHVDQVPAVIQRSLDELDRKRRALPGTGPRPMLAAAEPVDHLANIHEAMRGERRARTRDVLARLHEDDADLYGQWGPRELAAALADADVAVRRYEGNTVIRLEEIVEALADRCLDG